MKNIKKLSIILATVFILSSIFCVTVCANEDTASANIIDNDKLYAVVPEDYVYSGWGYSFYYCNDDYDQINYFVGKNTDAPNGVTALDEAKAKDIFVKYYIYEENEEGLADSEELNIEVKRSNLTKVNGLSAFMITGVYYYTDQFTVSSEVNYFSFCSYIFATQEDIFIITYEEITEQKALNLELKDLNETLKTLTINGTYFNGDKPTIDHSFEGAVSYADDLAAKDDIYYGSYEDIGDLGEMGDGIFTAATVLIIIFSVGPIAIFLIVAIVNIVKYSKNKAKLAKYQRAYGPIEFYGNNQGFNPQPNAYNLYGQNQNQTPYWQNQNPTAGPVAEGQVNQPAEPQAPTDAQE